MRDLVVREGLVAMARDAAKCLHGLVAAGEELPYEVREPGDGSPLCRYEPLTERFVRDHADDLRRLDSFGSACAALEASGHAGTYLGLMGVAAPAEPRRAAELAAIVFLCRVWMDTTDFSLDDDRVEHAVTEFESAGDTDDGLIDVIVPLRGLQMAVARLDLAGATIVRSDTVEVPAEARSSDGLGVSPWEPAYLAVVRVEAPDLSGAGDSGIAAVDAFRRLITTLRLFKAGGVGLGPYAWTRQAGDRWRRIATGAGRQRPGGYRLADSELGDLAAFSRALNQAGTPFSRRSAGRPGFAATLGRAIDRFEAGLERNVVIEALNDHLLALRFVLEGAGPASLGMPMRVAALCAEPERRTEVKSVVDRAIALERELWSGEPAAGSAASSPAETASELEELARAIFKDAAAGHLGSDLRVTADEILLADGFAAGDGAAAQRGGTTEWDLEPVETDDFSESHDREDETPLSEEIAGVAAELDRRDEPEPEPEFEWVSEQGSPLDDRISEESAPEPEEQLVIARAREIFGGGSEPEAEAEAEPQAETTTPAPADRGLVAVGGGPAEPRDRSADDMPSPVLRLIEQTKAERRAHHDRVAGLFPPPETTEWKVREIAYDRTRRARVDS
jgi:hypothetical protein